MPFCNPVYFDDPGRAADYGQPHDLAVYCAPRDKRLSALTEPEILHYCRHHSTAIGPFIIAMAGDTLRGIIPGDDAAAFQALRARWPGARLTADSAAGADYAARIDAYWRGTSDKLGELAVYPAGTAFQFKVWQALLQIPMGVCVSYSGVARWIGDPGAARAVGAAVAANPVALLIPCHRVVKAGGGIGGYAWGTARKQDLLATEAAVAAARRGTT